MQEAASGLPHRPLRVLVHSNAGPSETTVAMLRNLTELRGTPIEVRIADRSTPVLQLLHDLIFCCYAIVDGMSALSSVATLATLARKVIASERRTEELGLDVRRFGRVVPTKDPLTGRCAYV